MPELPEVERVRRTLEPVLVGASVTDVRAHRRDVVVAPGDPASGWSRSRSGARPRRLRRADLLLGRTIDRVVRHGKQLAIVGAGGPAVCAHLGMSGQLLLHPASSRRALPGHAHVVWTLRGRGRLIYRDPRRFGGLWVFPSLDELLRARWSRLGPDALVLTPEHLITAATRTRRAIKTMLMDQSVVAGIGNIYADEALFDAGIDPARSAGDLSHEELRRLARSVRRVLKRAVRAGGSTLRDYLDAHGTPGKAQHEHAVYGRASLACRRCGHPLEGLIVGQRSTVRCPCCQGDGGR